MSREIKVGDIVRITTDEAKARDMLCTWVDELSPWLGRLARVREVLLWSDEDDLPPNSTSTGGVAVEPLEVDFALGILDKRNDGVEDCWWFDNDLVELVEEAESVSA